MMKALSIRQPWAWLIVQGIKDIENRTWNTKYRGRFWIHASSFNNKIEYEKLSKYIEGKYGIVVPSRDKVKRGGIIGSAVLEDVIEPIKYTYTSKTDIWHDDYCYGFKLKFGRRLKFARCRGQLNFFEPFKQKNK